MAFCTNLDNLFHLFLIFSFYLDSNSTAIFSPAVVSQHVGLQQQETLHCHDLAYCSYYLLLSLPIHSLPS